jgi:hypothetical protein
MQGVCPSAIAFDPRRGMRGIELHRFSIYGQLFVSSVGENGNVIGQGQRCLEILGFHCLPVLGLEF